MNILVQLLIAVTMMVIGYMLTPKQSIPETKFKQGEKPTASAGSPIPRLFGTMLIEVPNCLWYGDKYFVKSKIDA